MTNQDKRWVADSTNRTGIKALPYDKRFRKPARQTSHDEFDADSRVIDRYMVSQNPDDLELYGAKLTLDDVDKLKLELDMKSGGWNEDYANVVNGLIYTSEKIENVVDHQSEKGIAPTIKTQKDLIYKDECLFVEVPNSSRKQLGSAKFKLDHSVILYIYEKINYLDPKTPVSGPPFLSVPVLFVMDYWQHMDSDGMVLTSWRWPN